MPLYRDTFEQAKEKKIISRLYIQWHLKLVVVDGQLYCLSIKAAALLPSKAGWRESNQFLCEQSVLIICFVVLFIYQQDHSNRACAVFSF